MIKFLSFLVSAAYLHPVRAAESVISGIQLAMTDCPHRCLSYDIYGKEIELASCRTAGNSKLWAVEYDCGGGESFFRLRNVNTKLCIKEPESCSSCSKGIQLTDCDSEVAALFSYGNLHKTGHKAYNLYSARCWLNEGLISVLSTPSLDAKSCSKDFTKGACERIEWNLDRFAKDVLYYEWVMNEVKSDCDAELHRRYGKTRASSYSPITIAFSSAAAALVFLGLVGMKSRQIMTQQKNDEIDGVVEEDESAEAETGGEEPREEAGVEIVADFTAQKPVDHPDVLAIIRC